MGIDLPLAAQAGAAQIDAAVQRRQVTLTDPLLPRQDLVRPVDKGPQPLGFSRSQQLLGAVRSTQDIGRAIQRPAAKAGKAGKAALPNGCSGTAANPPPTRRRRMLRTRATSSRGSKGLTMSSSAPSSSPITRATLWPRPVRINTPLLQTVLIWRTRTMLSMSGRLRSTTIRPNYLSSATAPLRQGMVLAARSIGPCLPQDLSIMLDRLTVLSQADPNRVLTGRLDQRRMGTFGRSLGGGVASAACLSEPRGLDLVTTGWLKPGRWVTSDAASMRLDRQRSGGWSEAEIDAHLPSMRAAYNPLPGAGYFVQVPGTLHRNVMHAPN